tara:strand:+ start:83 stop:184 length:102 start_codon:yes stop_codon:yes gene_type:complete
MSGFNYEKALAVGDDMDILISILVEGVLRVLIG